MSVKIGWKATEVTSCLFGLSTHRDAREGFERKSHSRIDPSSDPLRRQQGAGMEEFIVVLPCALFPAAFRPFFWETMELWAKQVTGALCPFNSYFCTILSITIYRVKYLTSLSMCVVVQYVLPTWCYFLSSFHESWYYDDGVECTHKMQNAQTTTGVSY